MNQTTCIELQRLMNEVLAVTGLTGKVAEIKGYKVRCYSKTVGNTTKRSLNFDLNGKRVAFAKLCATLA